jgi:hypothetical protein
LWLNPKLYCFYSSSEKAVMSSPTQALALFGQLSALMVPGINLLPPSASAADTGSAAHPVQFKVSSSAKSRATQRQEWDAFFSSQYTYWDAKVLSTFGNQSLGEAKARIGRKLLWGPSDQAILDQFLVDARVQALQSVERLDLYAESSYHYDDAQALANFWGDATPYDAKLRIERNLIMGNEQVVEDALQLVRRS